MEDQDRALQALPYHRAVVTHLKEHSPAVWGHFASLAYQTEHQEALRLLLLQTTFVLKRNSHPDVYALADAVALTLGIGVPVELYQGAEEGGLNASLLYQPGVARIVFHGPVQERLDPDELRALLGHELSHFRLWTLEEGVYLTASRALDGIVAMAALPAAQETVRLYSLTTEVYADRGGLEVSSLDVALRCLIKVRTGLSKFKATDFLGQSRELLAAQGTGSRQWTHPEAHMRALALDGYQADGNDADAMIRTLLEGPIQLDDLDLLRRVDLTGIVRQLLDQLLQPTWFQTDTILGQAKLMFDDYAVPEQPVPIPSLAEWGDTVLDFLAIVLVDFIAVDPSLEDLPLCRAHQVAETLGLQARLVKQVNKKLKRTLKSIHASLDDRDLLLAQADEEATDE